MGKPNDRTATVNHEGGAMLIYLVLGIAVGLFVGNMIAIRDMSTDTRSRRERTEHRHRMKQIDKQLSSRRWE